MGDFLAVRTVRTAQDAKPEAALTAVSTKSTPNAAKDVDLKVPNSRVPSLPPNDDPGSTPATPEDVLRLLRSQPGTTTLLATLRKLSGHQASYADFHLAVPGPLQSQIVNTVVTIILPDFWTTLTGEEKELLASCLRNLTGLNALLSRLRSLSGDGGDVKAADQLFILLEATALAFARQSDPGSRHNSLGRTGAVESRRYERCDVFVLAFWQRLGLGVKDKVKLDLAWKEAVNLLASGKIVSTTAQAEDTLRKLNKSTQIAEFEASWLASGKTYAGWLGGNIACFGHQCGMEGPETLRSSIGTDCGILLTKALGLGYPNALLDGLFRKMLASTNVEDDIQALMDCLPLHAKKRLLELTLRWLSGLAPSVDDHASSLPQTEKAQVVGATHALLSCFVSRNQDVKEHLSLALSDAVLTSQLSHFVRRGCITTLVHTSNSLDTLQSLLERLMATLSDRLFIDHAPIVQQEAVAQALLLTAGSLHRLQPMALLMIARSSNHMHGTSNRLDASGARARFLGMVVAEAVSELVDKEGSKMHFGVEDTRSEEALWYKGLTRVDDKAGTVEQFRQLLEQARDTERPVKMARPPKDGKQESLPMINGKPTYGPARPPPASAPVQTEVIGEKVTELLDDVSDDEDDDLKAYAKPDSDPEDSDEDATLVNRHKARAPVYVRELMAMLRYEKDVDRFQLGIKHAAGLIRRKVGFGSEVKDHAIELLGILSNLQDPFGTADFDELRLRAMIGILLSDVHTAGPWLSRQCFVEGYSIAQRCLMLSALGLGGREMAGFHNEDELNPALPGTEFASKKLPPRLHAIYGQTAPSTKRLESASKSLEDQIMQPLAMRAADQSTKHLDAVKVRTFSSRVTGEERTKRKPAPNQLAKVFGQAIFFPLVGRYHQEIAAYGSSSVFASSPILLVTFLKTLALLLHASGPVTLSLPDITAAFWDVLLGLRVQAGGDISVLAAVLFSFLAVLEVSVTTDAGKRRLAQEESKRLMETQQWVEVVFERAGGGELAARGGAEEAKVRTLAAGVLVKTREVVEAYQKELFGRVIE